MTRIIEDSAKTPGNQPRDKLKRFRFPSGTRLWLHRSYPQGPASHCPMLIRILLLCLLLVPAQSFADNLQPQTWTLPDNATFLQEYPLPPSAGDPWDRADVAYSIAIQAVATPEEIARANFRALFNVFTFSEVLGPDFNQQRFPLTAAFFQRLKETINPPKNRLKDTFQRPRPYIIHPQRIKPLVLAEAGYSYPSGHATWSWTFALVLAELDPGHRTAFLREAAAIGMSRVLGGMHYVSDVTMSRGLAEWIFSELMQTPRFQKDLEALRAAEWTPPPSRP